MNEVRPTQVTLPHVTRTVSSQGMDGKEALPASDQVSASDPMLLVPEEANLKTEEIADDAEVLSPKVEQAVTEINEYVQSIKRDLHFSVDEDSGLTVIRVRDTETGELIRQIPEDIFLNLAQNLKENKPLHLFDAHG